MEAIETRGLTKSFRGLYAVDGLDMHVPVGAIYGFIGENGSGKSTTEKLICGHLVPDRGKIFLFGKKYTDAGVRSRVGALIENAGCFPASSVTDNLMMQAINLGIRDRKSEIGRVLRLVKMEESARTKFGKCSLGMKQRVGIAMALLGDPALLILDEPLNGLDTDGMKLMRDILVDITQNSSATVLISSHNLGELEKIATHYGILRRGKLIGELPAQDVERRARSFVSVKCENTEGAESILRRFFRNVGREEDTLRVYGVPPEEVAKCLLQRGFPPAELKSHRTGLEDYYLSLMSDEEVI